MTGPRLLTAALLALASLAVSETFSQAQTTTVSTVPTWNGIDGFSSFGEPADATFGQTFVVPAGMTSLSSFAFFIDDGMNPDAVDFQAFVMAWDGLKASGPVLYSSGALTTTDNNGLGGFERINIVISGGLTVVPGTTYVAFFSASNLFDGNSGDSQMGVDSSGTYVDGGFVTLNNGSNFGAVTTNNWDSTFVGLLDLAFEFVFAVGQSSSGEQEQEQAPVVLLVDSAAISSVLFSSVPTALAQRELALGASRTTLRDFNSRLFRRRAGEFAGTGGGDQGVSHTVMVGGRDGLVPVRGGKGTKVVYDTLSAEAAYWQVYTSFDYGNFDFDADRNFLGLQSDTYAESIGVERAITQHLCIGGGVSYLESDADPGTDVDGVTLAAYVSGMWGGFYADLLYGATLLDHDIDRDTGFSSTAHGSPNSVTHSVNFNTGYNFLRGNWSLGPYAGLDYSHAKIDGYTESGGGTAATRVSEQSVDSLISRAGVQFSHHFENSWGSITPQLRAGWERENLGSDDDLTVGLLQSPYYLVQGHSVRSIGTGFEVTVPGQDRERDWFTLGAGVLVRIGPQFSLLLDYEADLLADGYTAHFGKLSFGWQF